MEIAGDSTALIEGKLLGEEVDECRHVEVEAVGLVLEKCCLCIYLTTYTADDEDTRNAFGSIAWEKYVQ